MAQTAMTMDAGIALDKAIAERVMRFRRVPVPMDFDGAHAGETLVPPEFNEREYRWAPRGGYSMHAFVPRYSTDLAAAWQIVRKMRDQADARFRSLTLVEWCYNRTYATFDAEAFADYDAATWAEANGEHCTPLAICRAALLALDAVSTPTGAPHDEAK